MNKCPKERKMKNKYMIRTDKKSQLNLEITK